MNIGVITFHAAFNYGSMLQAYAMQTILEKQGHKVEIINFRTKEQKLGYPKAIELSSLHNIKQSIIHLFEPSSISMLNKKWNRFDNFLHKYLNLTKEYTTLEELKQANFNYDILITGSDQIWNTLAFDFSEAYFGSFVGSQTSKVAYAPSMGPNPEKQDTAYLRMLLSDFKAVAVREARTKDFLEKNQILRNVDIVLDPTMLLDAQDYNSLYSDEPLIKGKYIFYYTPGSIRHEFLKEAEMMAEKMRLPVICDTFYRSKDLKGYKHIFSYPSTGPSEFLNLIKNAYMVCGASFHLMVFSILFKKNFYCMNGDVDSRMNHLMKTVGLENNIWSITHKTEFQFAETNYTSEIQENIRKAKEKSIEFLKKNLHID